MVSLIWAGLVALQFTVVSLINRSIFLTMIYRYIVSFFCFTVISIALVKHYFFPPDWTVTDKIIEI